MKRSHAGLATMSMITIGAITPMAQSKPAPVTVYKDPSCGCCAKWVDHLRQQGFATTTKEAWSDRPRGSWDAARLARHGATQWKGAGV